MTDPHIWWYVTRSSAILAWVLLSVSVIWGVLLSTRVFRRIDDAGHLQEVHRYLASVGLVLVGVHMASLMLDGWLHFTPGQVLIPGHASYRTVPVALGIVAFYALVIVYGSSLARRWLPRRFWKGLHYVNYVAVVLIAFHAGLTGTDTGRWWYLALAAVLLALTSVAVITRLLLGGAARVGAQPTAVAAEPPLGRPAAIEPPGTAPDELTLLVESAVDVADGVRLLRLIAPDRRDLPRWEPGAHVTLTLPDGGTRQYSLVGDAARRGFYEIMVRRDPASRGGSAWIHDSVRTGDALRVWAPRNHFPLVHAPDYLFVAGGVGITPLLSMIAALPAHRSWRLAYLGRSRRSMPLAAELVQRYPGNVVIYARDEHGARADLRPLLTSVSPATEVYCCGPADLISAVSVLAPPDRHHAEYFEPVDRGSVEDGPLEITAARSRVTIPVPSGTSVLDALQSRGIPVVASCRRGVCGSCEVRVIDGVPEHRDSVLTDVQKTELGIMFPCVSRSVGASLVLDV